ncbi:MAG: branched-chain amino acid ABC transporter substrate-binding protein [Methylobacteriaceae bacterium]|nr:branched-chain amino acid ABC transporter substrate-binding protein [Methylobacteriaceae bacterium]
MSRTAPLRRAGARLIFATVALLLPAAARAQDVTVALAGPITGPVAPVGDQMRKGAELAVEMINAAGGVLGGRKLKLVVEDDACDPKQAVSVANRIVTAGIKFVAGHACSGATIPASSVYGDAGVLMMSPAASNPTLTDGAAKNGWTTIMRLYGRDDAQGAWIGPWLAKRYAGKRIVILHDKSPYGQGLATEVRKAMNAAGLREVAFDGINAGEKDFSALVSKLKSLNPDLVYFGGYHTEAGLMIRQANAAGFNIRLMTGDGINTPEFWTIAGPGAEGTMFTFPVDPRELDDAKAAMARYRAAGVDPEGFTLYTYAVIQAFAEGMRRTGSTDPAKIAEALRGPDPIATVVGPVRFDQKGDILDPRYEINVWHDGRYAAMKE